MDDGVLVPEAVLKVLLRMCWKCDLRVNSDSKRVRPRFKAKEGHNAPNMCQGLVKQGGGPLFEGQQGGGSLFEGQQSLGFDPPAQVTSNAGMGGEDAHGAEPLLGLYEGE